MTTAEMLTGIGVMLDDLEAIGRFVRAVAKSVTPAVEAETVVEWVDDLLADLGTLEAELEGRLGGESVGTAK